MEELEFVLSKIRKNTALYIVRYEYKIGISRTSTHSVATIIGHHDEKIHGEAFLAPFRYEHVLRPSASTEIELLQIAVGYRSVLV